MTFSLERMGEIDGARSFGLEFELGVSIGKGKIVFNVYNAAFCARFL